MLILRIIIISFLLAACAASNTDYKKKPMKIDLVASEADEVSLNVDGLLQLGNIKVANWPFTEPSCKKCDVDYQKHYLPQGSEKTVSLIDSQGKVRLIIVDSKRAYKRTFGWSFRVIGNTVEICKDGSCRNLTVSETFKLESCEVSVVWFDKKQSKPHIADSAYTHFQAVIQCEVF